MDKYTQVTNSSPLADFIKKNRPNLDSMQPHEMQFLAGYVRRKQSTTTSVTTDQSQKCSEQRAEMKS